MNYKRCLFVAFTGTILIQFQVAESQIGCQNSSSTFGVNLNTTLTSLYTNVDNNGFYNASTGQGIDRANGMVLCVGDAQLSECEPICTIRYSNNTIFGAMETWPPFYYSNNETATSPEQFKEDTRALLDDLRNQAAATGGGSLRKVAAGNRTGPDFRMIFAMVQCSPDLSPQDCTTCLIGATAQIPVHCDGKIGCRVLWPSCNLRFEISPFFNQTRLQELQFTEPPSRLSPPGMDDGNNIRIVIAIVVPVVVCLILAASAIFFLRKKKKKNPLIQDPKNEIGAPEFVQYSFSTIKAATNDFSKKLGRGGFGIVYKGKLPNDEEIAVKRLSRNSGQGDLEFKNEVLLLAKLQHRNLVRLMGFALEGMEKLLVYEFVENASLDHFIFVDSISHSYLDWEGRHKIIVGIARGILYLHEDSRLRIIHHDLKPSNILLDRQMNPKIADFGMARLFGQDETRGNTKRRGGTLGYMSPEYIMHGQFSVKLDVFSFGVLVLEIICGRKNCIFQSGERVDHLLSYAWKNWRDGTSGNVVDSRLLSSSCAGSISEMVRCIHIGLLCVQENASDRPTMASVVLMLSSVSMTLAIPSQPVFYFPDDGSNSNASRLQEYNLRNAPRQAHSSRNEASISDLYPR